MTPFKSYYTHRYETENYLKMTDYLFQLPEQSSGTLQAQIQEMMVNAILKKHLPAGSLLPSGRKLAQQLKVSRNTVVLAYRCLMDEGFIDSRERSGFYVCDNVLSGHAKNQKIPRVSTDSTTQKVDWAKKLCTKPDSLSYMRRPENWQDYPYPFIYGQYDKQIFPISDWRDCCRAAAGISAIYNWAPDHIDQDNAELIKQIHEKLLPRRGIFVEREEILVTIGAQHAIYLVANLLLNKDKRVAVENPGYPDARNTFLTKTDHLTLLDVDDEGIVLDDRLQDCDCVYTTPSHQYPTTVTMSKERRIALLESAKKNDFIIIEDDYESELNYLGTPIPALKSLDDEGRVIHLGSLSKTLAPGIRLGFLVGPKAFIRQARALRRLMLRHPPANNQFIISLFLKRGYHDALARKITKKLYKRSVLMKQLLENYFPQAFSTLSFGGSSYWIKCPSGVDSQVLAKAAKKQGILIEPSSSFYHQSSSNSDYFRLSFSSINSDKIEQGIPLLATLLDRLNRR